MIHLNGDVIDIIKKLANLTDTIVVESAHPLYLEFKSKSFSKEELHQLEYNNSVVESFEELPSDSLNFLHSIKYLSLIFNRLGYKENFEPYEKLKKELPDIYGFDLTISKRYLIIFKKIKNQNTPIIWKDRYHGV